MLIVAAGPLENLLSRDSKLSTARRSDNLRNISIIKNANPSTRERQLGGAASHLSERLDFIGTSWTPVTAEVEISGLFEVVELQPLDGQGVILFPEFGVGAILMSVQEDHVLGHIVVIVEDILEIDIAFFAFVLFDCAGCFRVIDDVDRMLPSIVAG
jgi:hypothetical protein